MKNIRAVAIKTRINNLLKGTYVIKEGWEPNYIKINEKQISRVNIIGTIVGKEEMFLIDDGTGTIPLRSFEEEINVTIGITYMIIGKVREYNEQRYIIPEIIKEIKNKKWIELRNKELENEKIIVEEIEKNSSENLKKEKNTQKSDKKEKPILDLIQELDEGEGVTIEKINEKTGRNCDKELKKLVEEGELFSIKPGVLKVL